MKIMKTILSVLTIICFTACRNTDQSKQKIEKSNSIAIKTESSHINPIFDENVLSDIKKYYQEEYGENAKFEPEVTDSTYNITYRHIPDEEEPTDYFLIAIYIPTKNRDLIYGDLNSDNLQDLVVAVSTEGGGTGGNGIRWGDLFVFLNQNDKLTLASVTKDYELTDCVAGYFWPATINNGYLIGNSYCYDSEDAHCCPSLKYLTKVKFSKNKLVYQSQNKIK